MSDESYDALINQNQTQSLAAATSPWACGMCGQQVFPLIPNEACSTKLGADARLQRQAALKSFVSLPGADVDALVAYVQTLKK